MILQIFSNRTNSKQEKIRIPYCPKKWKENHATKVTKIPKTKRRKYGMHKTKVTSEIFDSPPPPIPYRDDIVYGRPLIFITLSDRLHDDDWSKALCLKDPSFCEVSLKICVRAPG